MKRKRYSVEQIIAAVKQNEMGTPVPDIAEQTFYRWKKHYGGLDPSQARELAHHIFPLCGQKCMNTAMQTDEKI